MPMNQVVLVNARCCSRAQCGGTHLRIAAVPVVLFLASYAVSLACCQQVLVCCNTVRRHDDFAAIHSYPSGRHRRVQRLPR